MPKTRSPRLARRRNCRMDRRFSYRFNRIADALAQHMLLHVDREFGLNLAEYRIMSVLADRMRPRSRISPSIRSSTRRM